MTWEAVFLAFAVGLVLGTLGGIALAALAVEHEKRTGR